MSPTHVLARILLSLQLLAVLTTAHAKEAAPVPALPKGVLVLTPSPAPDFNLKNLDGKSFSLKANRGHWVFVHFWASWCGPCRKELPAIQKMIKAMRNTSLKIMLVNTAETEDTVFNFFGKLELELDTLLDQDGQVTEQWKPRGLPVTVMVDPKGYKRYMIIGGRPWDSKPYLDFLHRLIDTKAKQTP